MMPEPTLNLNHVRPRSKSNEAQVWRKLWNPIHGALISCVIGTRTRRRRLSEFQATSRPSRERRWPPGRQRRASRCALSFETRAGERGTPPLSESVFGATILPLTRARRTLICGREPSRCRCRRCNAMASEIRRPVLASS